MQTFNARFLFKDYLLTIEKKNCLCVKRAWSGTRQTQNILKTADLFCGEEGGRNREFRTFRFPYPALPPPAALTPCSPTPNEIER